MEYNNNMPLKMLEHMPASLTKSNLENIQSIIDRDKYACSTMLGSDLCGTYAPFCALCDKSILNPCAVAYIRMRIAQDVQLETAVSNDELTDEEEVSENKEVEQTEESVAEPPKKRIRIATAKRKG